MTETIDTDQDARARGKSQGAFRTISEVAEELDVAQHVLRFWESKFAQVRPLKRGGGRRYYRPEDVDVLKDIRSLLYDEGYTIKGAQKLLRERRARPAPLRPRPAAAETPPAVEEAVAPETPTPARDEALLALRNRLIETRALLDAALDEEDGPNATPDPTDADDDLSTF
ncbi:MAG: MerR family transcriptional regulator [Geminicoccaceae bacterium]|nr:MerR family transcriptional regulator [Geminicoccaceae bacterium]